MCSTWPVSLSTTSSHSSPAARPKVRAARRAGGRGGRPGRWQREHARGAERQAHPPEVSLAPPPKVRAGLPRSARLQPRARDPGERPDSQARRPRRRRLRMSRASRHRTRRADIPGSTRVRAIGVDGSSQCARQDLNLRPRAPEARALSPELRARSVQCTAAVPGPREHGPARACCPSMRR